jgi:hypothetical protein
VTIAIRRPTVAGWLYTWHVTSAKQSKQPRVEVLPPAEARRRAAELPRRDQLVIEDVSELEWARFQQALTEA